MADVLARWQVAQRQGLPLDVKEKMSERRIRQWYDYWQGDVYVAFSGGKDSTVLLDMVRRIYPKVPAVFNNTGLEYPEIVQFVKSVPNVMWMPTKYNFRKVLKHFGFPVVSKEVSQRIKEARSTGRRERVPSRWRYLVDLPFKISSKCCDVMKKWPSGIYEKMTGRKPYLGMMGTDSAARSRVYRQFGCNGFAKSSPNSLPMGFWTEDDVWAYLRKYNIPYSTVYDMGYKRTGCMFCMFGVHLENPNRFQLMEETHPKLHKYCIEDLGCGDVLNALGVFYTGKSTGMSHLW
jgi:3'-phosphoadenosine 5'-phosphosulfate sulfotransferase (PAPS reductase)/FAD synthetase